MHGYLKQSTASQSRLVGPFLDDTDFKTAETGLTIANTDVKLCANGAASANKNSGGGTHRVNGMYGLTFDATDSATVGELAGSIVVAGALPVIFKFTVLEEAVYDALFGASALGYVANAPVNVAQVSGDATAADTLELFAEALDQSTGQLDAGSFATGTVATTEEVLAGMFTTDSGETYAGAVAGSVVKEIADNAGGSALTEAGIADAVWDEATAGHTTSGTFGEQCKTDIDAILVDTGTTLDARLPAALVSGRIDASVGAMAANTMTAAAAAADLTTELQSGLATSSAVSTLQTTANAIETDTQDIQSRIPAALNNGAIVADIQRINDVAVTGDGQPGTEFGVA